MRPTRPHCHGPHLLRHLPCRLRPPGPRHRRLGHSHHQRRCPVALSHVPPAHQACRRVRVLPACKTLPPRHLRQQHRRHRPGHYRPDEPWFPCHPRRHSLHLPRRSRRNCCLSRDSKRWASELGVRVWAGKGRCSVRHRHRRCQQVRQRQPVAACRHAPWPHGQLAPRSPLIAPHWLEID